MNPKKNFETQYENHGKQQRRTVSYAIFALSDPCFFVESSGRVAQIIVLSV